MIAPLDIKELFLNIFAGSTFIFVAIMLMAIVTLAAKFKMPMAALGMVIALFAVIFAIQSNWVLFLVVLIGGVITYFTIAKIVK